MKHKLFLRVSLIAVICFIIQPQDVAANNVAVSTNVSLTNLNMVNSNTLVNFDISWDNSWRISTNQSNWDAAWVFVKYRLDGTNWNHATLATSGHTACPGSTIDTPSDGKGVFIYRTSDGIGSVNYVGVQLRWDYGADGIALSETSSVDISVHAVEMVYIPEGSFYVGDGTSSNIKGQFEAGTTGNPFQITNESYEITLGGGGAGSLGNNNAAGMIALDDFNDTVSKTLPATFPKGYNGFYCMKYEISQWQYADFLNKLTSTQASNRYPNKSDYRHTIAGSYTNYSASARDRVCNWLNWADGAAYADWAGLRPMTELEFEKVCRGPLIPVANEYAWGNILIHTNAYAITNDGQPNAKISNLGSGTGNASYSTTVGDVNGPFRCGIFGASTNNPTREEAGATFYGVMEMSGNVWEYPVTVGNATGRSFTGLHGDGVLTSAGDANVANWPGTSARGAGFHGGCWSAWTLEARVSDRIFAASVVADRSSCCGLCAVRSAP